MFKHDEIDLLCKKCISNNMIRHEEYMDELGVAVLYVCKECNTKNVYHLCNTVSSTCKCYLHKKWLFFGRGTQHCEVQPGCKEIKKKKKL